jgi:hypothetical protein
MAEAVGLSALDFANITNGGTTTGAAGIATAENGGEATGAAPGCGRCC